MERAARKQVVLIVEDESLVRIAAADMIEEAGFEVIEAANAAEAIIVLEARRDITVVFTDIDMPGLMNGLKLAEAVKGRWPPIKIIATSGHHVIQDGNFRREADFFPSHILSGKSLNCSKKSPLKQLPRKAERQERESDQKSPD